MALDPTQAAIHPSYCIWLAPLSFHFSLCLQLHMHLDVVLLPTFEATWTHLDCLDLHHHQAPPTKYWPFYLQVSMESPKVSPLDSIGNHLPPLAVLRIHSSTFSIIIINSINSSKALSRRELVQESLHPSCSCFHQRGADWHTHAIEIGPRVSEEPPAIQASCWWTQHSETQSKRSQVQPPSSVTRAYRIGYKSIHGSSRLRARSPHCSS